MMTLEEEDAYTYGYKPEIWALAEQQIKELREAFPVGTIELLILGGNRASKTRYASWKLIDTMKRKAGSRVWGLQSIEAVSRSDQQPFIFNYIPREWRPDSGKLREGIDTKIVYSRAGGFTENTFVLQNKSQCWHKFYGANVKTLESAELDFAWADELITPDWIEAIRFRLLNRNGLLLVTFTPVEGYSATVKEYLDGASVLQEVEAELLPIRDADSKVARYECVPRVMQCANPKARVIFFHTADNPYGNYEAMKVELAHSGRERIMMRAYGLPLKSAEARFPLFKEQVHVVSLNSWDLIKKENKLTRFLVLDPCSARNWFMIWVAIDVNNRHFVYREWPSYGHTEAYIPGIGQLGEWAVPGKAFDGDRGPAQQEMGWSLLRYREEIFRCEKDEKIFERWIDSKYGNTRIVAQERSVTLIEELQDIGLEFLASPSEKKILDSDSEDSSLRLLNTLLYYDKDKPIDHTNAPHLYILETCPNVIFALKQWTGEDGRHGATKDPIDCLRYMVLSGLAYCDDQMLKPRNPWNRQFERYGKKPHEH